MKIVCISDTHTQLNLVDVPDGDILVHAGDALNRGLKWELIEFLDEYETLPHKHKIYVPGNHDWITEKDEPFCRKECEDRGIIYLNDSGINIEGIEFWGSGVTPRFGHWAWNRDSGRQGHSNEPDHFFYDPIQPHWDLISDNVDILITHGPPIGILDVSVYNGALCGCGKLLKKVEEVKPKYHVFGHIHQWGGQTKKEGDTIFINASVCNEQYKPVNKIVTIDYDY